METVEKKEYTLQLLEQRLYDCEKFLRDWGKKDDTIRTELQALKLNPDFEKKRISNVVMENGQLKTALKEALDEIQTLHKQFQADMSLRTSEMIRSSQVFFEPVEELPFEEIQERGELSHREKSALNKKIRKKKLTSKEQWKRPTLSIFENPGIKTSTLNLEKLKLIKHAYPEEYEQKLEAHLELLEMELTLKKAEVEKVKEESERSKDAIAALENVNEKLNHALEKKTKELDKHLLSLGGTGEMGGISKSIASASSIYGGMRSKAKKEVKKTID